MKAVLAAILLSSWPVLAAVGPTAPPSPSPDTPTRGELRAIEAQEVSPSTAPDDDSSSRPVEATIEGATLIDAVLPAGVRVIAAQDDTLPVAAVVLAVEAGTEDDPPGFPGLVHALAYHLLQGNRDIAPSGIASMIHGAGGTTNLAVGPGQIRFESLVPISLLGETLWAEAQRLRAPTVNEALWRESLAWARRDPPRRWSLPLDVRAAVHGEPGLGHDGRTVSPALLEMSERAVAAQIADRMTYDRATLVVVAPLPPAVTLARVQPLFADLPPVGRRPTPRDPPPPLGDTPRSYAARGQDGTRLAWALAPGPASIARARVLCGTLQRQRRIPDEPARARVRCSIDPDPRRATLVVRVTGTDDPIEFLRQRLARIDAGSEASLLARQRRLVLQDLELSLRTPLELARTLAWAPPRTDEEATEATAVRSLDTVTGLAALRSDAETWTLPLGAAVRLVAPSVAKPAEEAAP